MKKLCYLVAAFISLGAIGQVAEAHEREYVVEAPKRNLNDGYDRYYNHHRSRYLYVIEDHRPVRRRVFVDERGRYYRVYGDQRVFVTHYWSDYPTQYYYRDGRPRVGVSIHF